MRTAVLERTQVLPAPVDAVFAPFADATNLQAITPPWLHFRIESPDQIAMETGTCIDYRLRLHGIPVQWRTRIVVWEPPLRFIDVQTRGPYALWHHTHVFSEVSGGTLAVDRVQYRIGFGPFGDLAHWLLVRSDHDRIFDYRQEAILKLLGLPSGRKSPSPAE